MGVLSGYKIVEFAGIGPAPMCAMLLSDMGAEMLRLDRAEDANLGINTESKYNLLGRGRRSVAIDLKRREGTELALKLIERADALIEGFRPGVMERLGLGPDVCQARNPKLVYGRMTGWGQDGPLALAAGHDINYIALTGALHSIGRRGEAPGAAAQPGRRLRRRRRVPRAGRGGGTARSAEVGQGTGDRCRDDRRRVVTDGRDLRLARRGRVERQPRRKHPRHRRALLQRLRDQRRQVRLDRFDRGQVLRRAAAAHRVGGREAAAPERSHAMARVPRAAQGGIQDQDPRPNGARSWKAARCASRPCSP